MTKDVLIKNNRPLMAPHILEWMQESPEDREKRKREFCKNCKYSWHAFGSSRNSMTQVRREYILITGHMRGCSPINCKKFEPRSKKVIKRSFEIKHDKSDIDIGDWVFDGSDIWNTGDSSDVSKQG